MLALAHNGPGMLLRTSEVPGYSPAGAMTLQSKNGDRPRQKKYAPFLLVGAKSPAMETLPLSGHRDDWWWDWLSSTNMCHTVLGQGDDRCFSDARLQAGALAWRPG